MGTHNQDTTTAPQSLRDVLRSVLSPVRRMNLHGALLTAGTLAIVAGIALNWTTLIAAGFAPLILALLPCVAMCAVGLWMSRSQSGNSKESGPNANEKSGSQ